MKRLFFSKNLRLLNSHDFISVFKKPFKIKTPNIIIFSRKNELQHPRIGLIIAKKNVKKAYKRNYIKRLIREKFRIYQHILPNMDFIILVQRNIISAIQDDIFKQELQNMWSWFFCL
ncbi:ribonuclease P protein component [Blochmannia endosymbiont of Camponotus (Colobopsis) obliquus]|uniref:ribonuclease P protein component n=1 Tax=Blochmannia endosymbiont of Camponotus (Colobopsis) obliquus TaxID=1505597 RepID=UPI00061A792B|nr:ribonuclease P protein component [Blochmannia endosymbiont of Camponotus (Colobopsis) obliquus]AKC60198.1 ribonuclease P protein component [Blochmannia endosymbiont of Camponotus (Colobopsis) obliquus]